MELFKDIKPTLRKNFPEVHSDRADLYVYFYGRALQLLKNGGMLTFISSNKWLRAKYGGQLRKQIAHTCHVTSITDFGELPIFQSAATFPMIFAAQKGSSRKQTTTFAQVKSLEPPYPDVATLIREIGHPMPLDALEGADWNLADPETLTQLRRMTASSIPLAEYVAGRIYYGIKTGLNEAFIIDEIKREELLACSPISAEIIKPLISGNDVRKWRTEYKDKWLLYMNHGIDVSGLQTILDHLRPYRQQLERRPTKQEWYELQQPQARYASELDKAKIVFPDIAKESRFSVDVRGAYLSNTAYSIPVYDLYLLGVLNSSAVWLYAKATFSCLGDPEKGGRFRFIYHPVSKIPIPNAPVADREVIAELVRKCLDAKGVGCEEWEAEIDGRVASLYGL
jgi:hypothetical protein